MPKLKYQKVSNNVRRLQVSETQAEREQREKREKAHARLAKPDTLPSDAPEWAQILWERLMAIEDLLR